MTDSTAQAAQRPSARPIVARRSATTDLALVGTFAALVAVCSLIAVRIPIVAVPVTLQTFAVLLAGAVLGARRGAFAVLLYLAVGLAGLPVFAEAKGGPAVLASFSAGYLLAFPLAALVVGLVAERAVRQGGVRRALLLAGGAVAATLTIYAVGVPVLAARAGMALGDAVVINNAFVPLDALKAALVVIVALAVHRAFPDLLATARPARPVGPSAPTETPDAG